MSIFPEDNGPPGCGWGPFKTGKDDPLYDACVWHDNAFDPNSWVYKNVPRERIDLQFKLQMKEIAGQSFWKNLRRRVYSGILDVVEPLFW